MKTAIETIVINASDYPDFRYYIGLMKKAESNLKNRPDISIEICKALLEGVSKTIIEQLDSESNRADLEKRDAGYLVKRAAKLLSEADNVVEADFVTRCSSLAYALATLRNERGDISHGKAVPKTIQSDGLTSGLAFNMTESVICYFLQSFFRFKAQAIQVDQKVALEAQEPESDGIELIEYDECSDFNDHLDGLNPIKGKVLYSSALYQLYYEDYLILYREYIEPPE